MTDEGSVASTLRVTVVMRREDAVVDPFDGWAARRRGLLEALLEHHHVAVILLDSGADVAPVAPLLSPHVMATVPMSLLPSARVDRMRRVARRALWAKEAVFPWERLLLEAARSCEPDVVVAIGPWLDEEFRSLYAAFPTFLLMEEDLTRVARLYPQSLQARLLRRINHQTRGRGPRPRCVGVIAESEVAHARERFPGASVVYIPFALDSRDWPRFTSPSRGDDVAVVGVLWQDRNARGLVEVLVAAADLGAGLQFRLISDSGIHGDLVRFLRQGAVSVESGVDLVASYRRAGATLVPSREVSGIKTTVLQGWACGCPVVCFDETARALSPAGRRAVVAGSSGASVAEALARVLSDARLRADLAKRGGDVLRDEHCEGLSRELFLTAVAKVAASHD